MKKFNQILKSNLSKKNLIKITFFTLIFTLLFSTTSFCATQKIVTRIENALEKVSEWIVKIATPAAAVAIGSGLLIKKFSFGDEERMITGKKIIRNSIFSYAFILVIDLVLDAIKSIMT